MSFLDSLNWRNATKAFDKTKKVSSADLGKIMTAIQMAPSSYGMQPYYVLHVKDEAKRKQLQEVAYSQDQVLSASDFFVFVRRLDVVKRVDELFEGKSGGNNETRAKMKDYEARITAFAKGSDEKFFDMWTAKQTYIALGFALAACAELKIDSCPMEGFLPEKADQILGLPKGERSSVLLAVGYRDQAVQIPPKFRFSQNDLIRNI